MSNKDDHIIMHSQNISNDFRKTSKVLVLHHFQELCGNHDLSSKKETILKITNDLDDIEPIQENLLEICNFSISVNPETRRYQSKFRK